MLPNYVIAKILEREKRNRKDDRPQITLDIPMAPVTGQPQSDPSDYNRGVVIIDLMGQ